VLSEDMKLVLGQKPDSLLERYNPGGFDHYLYSHPCALED